jgi:GT2 family glycosyltransferase
VIVVIDGSDDGTDEALASFEAPFALRSVRQTNRGRAAAINAGLAVAAGELVAFLDDDLEAEPGFLAAHLGAHDRSDNLGVVGAVHSRVDDGTPPFARYWGMRFDDFLTRLAARPGPLAWTETYTGAFSARLAVLQSVGGFDEAFDGYGLEDFELALRLTQAGVALVLCPEAAAFHDYDKDFPTAAREAESRGRSAVIFAALHPEIDAMQFAPRDVSPPSVARRLVRYGLPRMSSALPFIPGMVTRSVGRLERKGSRRLDFAYMLGLEYFFLLGVHEARRDGRLTARGRRR